MFKKSGILIIASWLIMLGLLVQKNTAASVPASTDVRTGEQWFGIYMGGAKVGHAVSAVERAPDGYRLKDEMTATLSVMGMPQVMHTVTSSEVGPDLSLRDFRFELSSGIASMVITGRVEGDVLKFKVESAGTARKSEVKLDETPHLSSDVELYILRQGLEAGKRFRVPFFDPATLTKQYMDVSVEAAEDIKVGDRLTRVYRVREEYSGISATSWIDPETGTIKGEGPMGMTMLRMTKEQAMSREVEGAVDITEFSSIPAGGRVPDDARAVRFMKAKLSGAEFGGFFLSGERQKYADGMLEVSSEDMPEKPVALPVTDAALARFTAPEQFIQSDDPEIRKAAGDILAGETDALRAARKINDWVYKNLEKKPSAGVPSAVEVLKNRSGDCNEHTTLFAALARAVGLPARMDGGVVLMGGRFYYHAWPEVYVGGWVAADPTLGQFPADAAHIRFTEGGLDEQVRIVKLVGKMKIEIQEYK